MSRFVAKLAIALSLTLGAVAPRADSMYHAVAGWAPLPAGITWGETAGITMDKSGIVYAFTRAEPPVIQLDASGKVIKTWGKGMFVWPHGIRVDRNGFLWI